MTRHPLREWIANTRPTAWPTIDRAGLDCVKAALGASIIAACFAALSIVL